jgi:alkyl hydroperoxide reductase subunit AhpC
MPGLIRLQKEFKGKNLELIILSADDIDSVENAVRPMLREFGIHFQTYIMNDKQETFMSAINPEWNGALALPTTYVFDRHGTLVDMMIGGKTYDNFKDAVTKFIAN